MIKKLCVKFISAWQPHIQAKLTQAFNPHFCVSFAPGSAADPPMKAYVIDGDLHFIYDDRRVQITAEVENNGDLQIGYNDTQITNIRMDGDFLYYDFLGV